MNVSYDVEKIEFLIVIIFYLYIMYKYKENVILKSISNLYVKCYMKWCIYFYVILEIKF